MALNCVANGKVLRDGPFEQIWVQPAAGDAGGALGRGTWPPITCTMKAPRLPANTLDAMQGSYLGPGFSQAEIERRLSAAGAIFEVMEEPELLDATTTALVEGRPSAGFRVAWSLDRERSGNRSILGDPRSPQMQKTLNLQVKYRESFRPFAPSVLREDVQDWFEIDDRQPVHAARRRCRERPAPRDDR